METETNKRSRGVNYTVQEKQILLELIDKYKGTIENKKSDSVHVKQKERVWEQLRNEFNGHLEVTGRTVKQLRQYYDNLKRTAKKAVSNDKVERLRTGGGVFKPAVDDETAKLVAIIEDQVRPMSNPHDCDSEYNGKQLFINKIILLLLGFVEYVPMHN